MTVEAEHYQPQDEPLRAREYTVLYDHQVEAPIRDYTREFFGMAIRLTNEEDNRAYIDGLIAYVNSLPHAENDIIFPTVSALAEYIQIPHPIVSNRLSMFHRTPSFDQRSGGRPYRYLLWDLIFRGYRYESLAEQAEFSWEGAGDAVRDYFSWPTLKEFANMLPNHNLKLPYLKAISIVHDIYGASWQTLCGNTIKGHQAAATLPPSMQEVLRETIIARIAGTPNSRKGKPRRQVEFDDGEEMSEYGEPTERELKGIDTEPVALMRDAEIDELLKRTSNLVSMYLIELKKTPLLSKRDEVVLAKRIERGKEAIAELATIPARHVRKRAAFEELIQVGKAARELFIKANLRLVVSIAKKYIRRGIPFLDLIQEGNLGVIKAVGKFDYRRGHRFSTPATWWIRQMVTRAISNQARTIRLPVHFGYIVQNLYRTMTDLEQQLGHPPTVDELAEEMKMTAKRVTDIILKSLQPLSLDAPRKPGSEDERETIETMPDTSSPSTEEAVKQRQLRPILRELFNKLSDRERRIMELRYIHGMTLEEIGQDPMFRVTRERIRQIEARALRRLRHPNNSRRLRDYDEE